MIRILSLEQNAKYRDRLRVLWANKLSLCEHVDEIRSIIRNLYIPNEYLEQLHNELNRAGVHAPYSVRSSSIYEDMGSHSAPGVFETFLNVSDEMLLSAIRKCWMSNFSLKSMFYFGNQFRTFDEIKMGVMIQTMQPGDYAGIMFTANPVTGKKEIVVELTGVISEKLTDGAEAGQKIIIDPVTGDYKSTYAFEQRFIEDLIHTSNTLSSHFEREVDIEWCVKDDEIYVIQVRPITTLDNSEKTDDSVTQICSISEIDRLHSEGVGLERSIAHWKGKKQHFNRSCDKMGVPHLSWYFVENYNNTIKDELNQCILNFSGEYVTFALNSTLIDVVKRKEEAIQFVDEMFQKEQREHSIFSVRDIPMNQLSVISNVIEDDVVYIEAIEGIMKGLKTGELRGTSLKIAKDGTILAKEEYHEKKRYEITFPSGETYFVDNEITSFDAYESKFKIIAEYTRRLYADGQVGAVEWWICGEQIFAADISLNVVERELITSDTEMFYVSRGMIDGQTYIINDEEVEELNQLAFGTGISVDRIDAGVMNNICYKKIREAIMERRKCNRIILVVRKPYLGIAPILDLVDGVIFEEASMLCHLSVILREKKIPGIVVGEQFASIQDKEMIQI